MQENITLLPVTLSLFDGGGDGNAGGGPTTGGGPTGGGPTAGGGPAAGSNPSAVTGAGARDGTTGAVNGGPGQAPAAPLPPLPPLPAQARREAQLRAWDSQAEQVKALYPSFDLSLEARSRDFRAMLRAGVPMRQAFEVLHMEQIKAAQAQAAERAVTANIRARGARPQENGAGAASAFTVKDDVSRLTAQDRAEMARRAARGETITF